jgi:hypothetical protein
MIPLIKHRYMNININIQLTVCTKTVGLMGLALSKVVDGFKKVQ